MNELDEIWSQMLCEALAKASAEGRHDVADYLSLKASNDSIRMAGVRWLFGSFAEIASDGSVRNPDISIEKVEPHNFPFRGANLVGSLIRLRRGLRCLTIEAGWTRTPSDGFVRGGALAIAKIGHFGLPKANIELSLGLVESRPCWYERDEDGRMTSTFGLDELRKHFLIFVGE